MLVVAADVYSRILDFSDRRTAVLFGDGAGAAVVGAVPAGYGILETELVSRGAAHQLIRVEAGGSRLPASAETVAEGRHYQANGVMLGELVDLAQLDGATTHLTLDRYGNVGSASVPVALDAAARSGQLRDGDLVLLAGFGGGMAVGAACSAGTMGLAPRGEH